MAVILITGALTSKAQQIKLGLTPDNIIIGDYGDLPAFMETSGAILKLPDPKSKSYLHEMLALCLDHGIKKLYTVRPEEQTIISTGAILFEEFQIELFSDN